MWFSTADCVDLNVCDIQLSIVQNNNTMHVGTTIWESSLVFAKWLERQEVDGEFNHKTLREKRAIELGAGCGIAGMAMAISGCNMVLTDIQAVLPILKKNLKRNQQNINNGLKTGRSIGKIKTAQLSWGNKKHVESVKPPFDFVLATDVVYLEEIVQPLIDTMCALCDSNTKVLLGYRMRQEEAHALFWEKLPHYFTIRQIPDDQLHPEYSFEGVSLYVLQKIV